MTGYVPAVDTFDMLDRIGNNFLAGQQRNRADELFAQANGAQPEQPGIFARMLSGQNPFAQPPAPQAQPALQHPASSAGAGAAPHPMKPFQDAIASIESDGSGGYSAIGPKTASGDQAYGKYQVMGANLPQWTQEVLGRPLTPQQFLASPQAQDAVFNAKFGSYLQSTGNPQDAASIWFTGRPLAQGGAAARDVNGMSGSGYSSRFQRALDTGAGGGPAAGPNPNAPPVQLAGPPPAPDTVPAAPGAAPSGPAIEVPGYGGQFTRAQAEAAQEGDTRTPGTDEWDAAAARQPGGRLNMTPAPGSTGPSGVPAVGSGATSTPMGQGLRLPHASDAMLMQLLNTPYGEAAKVALQQRIKQGELSVQEYAVNNAQGETIGYQKAYMAPNGQQIPIGPVDTNKVKGDYTSEIRNFEYEQKHPEFQKFLQTKKGMQAGGPLIGADGQPVDPSLAGPAVLGQLPPDVAKHAQAILETREQWPTAFAQARNPELQQALVAAQQADPELDQTKYAARQAMRRDTESGNGRINLANVANNTALNHSGALAKAIIQLNNSDTSFVNSLINSAAPNSGFLFGKSSVDKADAVRQFSTERDAVSNELEKSFHGVGSTSEQAVKRQIDNLSSSDPPQVQLGALKAAQELLAGKILVNEDNYRATMGEHGIAAWEHQNKRPFGFITPDAARASSFVSQLYNNVRAGEALGGPSQRTPPLGSVPIPMGAAARLKANPGKRSDFDAIFGAGASDQVLGPARQGAPSQFTLPPNNGQPLPAGVM